MTEPTDVRDNQADNRFELVEDGHLAELVYRTRADRLVLVHTEVPDELGGRGLGGVLVRAAVARAAQDGLTIVPLCSFARSWLEKHPDALGDVAVDWETRG
jgi:predicted GNAT family acetyltransferase